VSSKHLVGAVVAGVALWAVASTGQLIRSRLPPDPASRVSAPEEPAHRVDVDTRAEVRSEVAGSGLRRILVLMAGRPRRVTTYRGEGRGIFAETVYRVRGRKVVLRQSTAAPPGARVRPAYIQDVPGTAQSSSDIYWADNGYILSLSRSGASEAGELRWFPPGE
jgi:hypothetical protein